VAPTPTTRSHTRRSGVFDGRFALDVGVTVGATLLALALGAATCAAALGSHTRIVGLLDRFRRQRIPVTKVPGGLVVGDLDSFGTEQHPPTQADLDEVIGAATSVAVREPMARRKKRLLETGEAADLDSLREALRIHDGGIGHCMCFGSLELEFARGAEPLGAVTLHHGVSVRWQPFFDNAELAEPEKLLDWLSDRGITSLREEYDENRRRPAQREADVRRWLEAMPAVVEPLWPSMEEPFSLEWPEVAEALADEYPDPVVRARALMEWLGHGAGPWSGFPSYEQVPAWCLLQLPLDALVEAAQHEPRCDELLEGAARLFASWHFGQERGDELARVPAELKRALLEHARRSNDGDKRARAADAFAR
jgi:hypothetical protein